MVTFDRKEYLFEELDRAAGQVLITDPVTGRIIRVSLRDPLLDIDSVARELNILEGRNRGAQAQVRPAINWNPPIPRVRPLGIVNNEEPYEGNLIEVEFD